MPSDPAPTWPASSWTGRYSDGKTAGSVPADVRLTDRGVEIGFPGAPQALVWPYGALGVAAPLTRSAADVLLTYSFMPGATLFVADAGFARAVAKAAPQLTSRAFGWRSARPWIIAAACAGVIALGVWAADLSPSKAVASLLPDRVRTSIGEQVISAMGESRRQCTAPAGHAALDRLVARLAAGAGTTAKFNVRVLDWGLLNAFAVPGSQIVLTRQIITQAKTPDEVAGVLAHEMGHAIELHPETALVRMVGLTAAVELMTGGGGTLANIGLMLTQLGYTRAAEREADAHALRMLEKAEISPAGIAEFFRRIGTIENKAGAPEWDLLRSHPNTEERAKAAANRPSYRATPAMSDADWQALRAICVQG